ncbi:MAG: thiamine biosynthesis protein ThiF [Epsilonproteobacteria bacterium]|nr:thiamine biosynthesis protein ThiF [Campylobacterota bacterium]
MCDLSSPLVCEGIIGDGCGGGRLFVVEDGILFAYDPYTKEKIVLQEGIKNAKQVSKKGCIVSVVCSDGILEIDLSQINS